MTIAELAMQLQRSAKRSFGCYRVLLGLPKYASAPLFSVFYFLFSESLQNGVFENTIVWRMNKEPS